MYKFIYNCLRKNEGIKTYRENLFPVLYQLILRLVRHVVGRGKCPTEVDVADVGLLVVGDSALRLEVNGLRAPVVDFRHVAARNRRIQHHTRGGHTLLDHQNVRLRAVEAHRVHVDGHVAEHVHNVRVD